MSLESCGLPIERLNGGEPIIVPTERWWENGVAFNSAALLIEDPALIRKLTGDNHSRVVALHYRARPKSDLGFPLNRSYVGLAVFTPEFALIRRFEEPVVSPGDFDALGVEDPRVTVIDGNYYMIYCGVQPVSPREWRAQVCLAASPDLLSWGKLGPVKGDVNFANNKDGVLFPEQINGKYALLHRPMVGNQGDFAIELALSDSMTGEWRNLGKVLKANPHPLCRESWVGAGSVPIPLGDCRYLVIFHTGNYLHDGGRAYQLDAAIFDMARLDAADPSAVVTHRLDRIMVPETSWEIDAPTPDSVGNVVFACGSYELGDHIYIVYGGGDTYILAARVRRDELLAALEENPVG